MSPEHYKTRILLIATGMSPQVVTETLYALSRGPRPFLPTEIHLVTTAEGRDRARLTLLLPEQGLFHQLRSDYGLPEMGFSELNIHVVCGEGGGELSDIRTPEDNRAMANHIMELVRNLTSENKSALHVSLAGGRKTMGYYIGQAISLFGRPQDRLSHVLVSEHFESHPDFFYPTPYDKRITTRDGRPLNTKDAQVTLAEIDFVRLRDELPANSLVMKTGFSDCVAMLNAALDEPHLTIDYLTGVFRAGAIELDLTQRERVFFAWFARRAKEGKPPITKPGDVGTADFNEIYRDEYLQELERWTCGRWDGNAGRTEDAMERGMDKGFVEQRMSYLKKAIHGQLGNKLGAHYLIARYGARNHYTYALPLEANQITIIE